MVVIDKPMSTIDTLNTQIATLEAQRIAASSELMRLNGTLATAKFGKRGGIEKAIKNLEQEIKNIDTNVKNKQNELTRLNKSEDRTERTEDRQTTKQTAYEHGIDPNAAWANAAGVGFQAAGNAITALVNPLGGAAGKQPTKITEAPTGEPTTPPGETPFPKGSKYDGYPMYIAIAAVLVYFLFFKKK